jgi:hypothetical protein
MGSIGVSLNSVLLRWQLGAAAASSNRRGRGPGRLELPPVRELA